MIGELDRTYRPGHGARADKVAAFLSSYVGYVERHPELLQLDPLGHGVLERNLEAEALLAFKRTLLDRLTAGATILEGALGLPSGRGLQLLTRTYAMTRGLGSRSTICSIPQAPLNPFSRSFATERLDALSEYWRGALARH